MSAFPTASVRATGLKTPLNHEASAISGASHSTGTTLQSALSNGRHSGAIQETFSIRTGPSNTGARSTRASAAARRSRGNSVAEGSRDRTRCSIVARSSKRGVPLLAAFLGIAGFVIYRMLPVTEGVKFGAMTHGSPQEIGRSLFQTYVLPFEVTSVLILIAILGAVVLARKEVD